MNTSPISIVVKTCFCFQVLQDERMKEAIEDTTKELVKTAPEEEQSDELYKQIFTAQEARARRILYDMRSTLSDLLLR